MLKRIFFYTAAYLIIGIALLLSSVRLLMPLVSQHQAQLQQWVSHTIRQPVHIDDIQPTWYGLEPGLRFKNVTIFSREGKRLAHIDELALGINWWQSLTHWRLLPGLLTIHGVKLHAVQNQQGEFVVRGFQNLDREQRSVQASTKLHQLLWWVFTQARIDVQQVAIDFKFKSGLDLRFKNIQLQARNGLLKHHVVGSFQILQTHPATVQFDLAARGQQSNWHDFSGRLYTKVKHLNFVPLRQLLREQDVPIQLQRGLLAGQMWLTWHNGQLEKWQSLVRVQHAALRQKMQAQLPTKIKFRELGANIAWQRLAKGWQVSADQLQIADLQHKWALQGLGYRQQVVEGQLQREFSVKHLSFKNIQQILNRFHTKNTAVWQSWWRRLQPKGLLDRLQVMSTDKQWTVAGKLADLGTQPTGKLPGVKHLAANFYVTPQFIQIKLAGHATVVSLPKLLKSPVKLDALQGKIIWQKLAKGWQVLAQNLNLQNKDARVFGGFHLLQTGRATSPIIHLLLGLKLLDAGHLRQYIPTNAAPGLQKWLRQAFISGSIPQGVVVLNGPLHLFPFDGHTGRFLLGAKFQDIDFQYHPAWPHMFGTSGYINFDDRRMDIRAQQGTIVGSAMRNMSAVIPNLAHAILTIRGQTDTSLQKGQAFLQRSPLLLGTQLKPLHLSGPVKIGLQLIIPLRRNGITVSSAGTLQIDNAKLDMPTWGLAVHKLAGALYFTNASLTSKSLDGKVFDRPFHFTIATNQKTRIINIALQGSVSAPILTQYLNMPIDEYLTGSAALTGAIQLRQVGNALHSQINLSSDLQGMSTRQLPREFMKSADQARLLRAKLTINNTHGINVNLNYAKTAQLAVSLLQKNKKWKIHNLQAHIPKISLWHQVWHNIDLSLQHTLSAYTMQFKTWSMAGNLTIPKSKSKPWHGHFSYIKLPVKKGLKTTNFNLAKLPPLQINIDELELGKFDFGKVYLDSRPLKNGFKLNYLHTEGQSLILKLWGKWQRQRTQIEGSLYAQDAGAILKETATSRALEGGKTQAQFKLGWKGSPQHFNAKTLNGFVHVLARHGNIIKLNSKTQRELGFGRILNLLSLQSLSRRLTLNFGDLVHKGFYFSSMQGDFKLHNGVASTSNGYLKGPVAGIQMRGDIGFAKHTYNLNLIVAPHLTSSAPIIASIFGGPLAGLVTWVANQFIGPGVGKIFGSTYVVTGSWRHPKVAKLEKSKHHRR